MSEIKDILLKYKTIAMIGVSQNPSRPSTIVMKYMQKYGYKVIPVNPRIKGEKILGGAEAFLAVWKKIPKYKFLYNILKLPIIFSIFSFFYEIIAFILYHKNKSQLKN